MKVHNVGVVFNPAIYAWLIPFHRQNISGSLLSLYDSPSAVLTFVLFVVVTLCVRICHWHIVSRYVIRSQDRRDRTFGLAVPNRALYLAELCPGKLPC